MSVSSQKRPRRPTIGAAEMGHEPPPAPQQFRVALMESCQRDVPKSPRSGVTIRDSVIRNFDDGIFFVPNSSTLSQLYVSNTRFQIMG